jgi:hypothetical protein
VDIVTDLALERAVGAFPSTFIVVVGLGPSSIFCLGSILLPALALPLPFSCRIRVLDRFGVRVRVRVNVRG